MSRDEIRRTRNKIWTTGAAEFSPQESRTRKASSSPLISRPLSVCTSLESALEEFDDLGSSRPSFPVDAVRLPTLGRTSRTESLHANLSKRVSRSGSREAPRGEEKGMDHREGLEQRSSKPGAIRRQFRGLITASHGVLRIGGPSRDILRRICRCPGNFCCGTLRNESRKAVYVRDGTLPDPLFRARASPVRHASTHIYFPIPLDPSRRPVPLLIKLLSPDGNVVYLMRYGGPRITPVRVQVMRNLVTVFKCRSAFLIN